MADVRFPCLDSPIQLLEEGSFKVAIEGTRDTLLAQEDTNHDLQITVDDKGPKVAHSVHVKLVTY